MVAFLVFTLLDVKTQKMLKYVFLLHLRIITLVLEEEINHQSYPAPNMLSYSNQWPSKADPWLHQWHKGHGSDRPHSDCMEVQLHKRKLIPSIFI